MTELTNKVEVAGDITNIKRTDNGSVFAQINQEFTGHDGLLHKRFFKFYIRNTNYEKFASSLVENKNVLIKGKLDVFKSKFGPSLIIDVEEIELMK